MELYRSIGIVSIAYHTDILSLINLPITDLYYHFILLNAGKGH